MKKLTSTSKTKSYGYLPQSQAQPGQNELRYGGSLEPLDFLNNKQYRNQYHQMNLYKIQEPEEYRIPSNTQPSTKQRGSKNGSTSHLHSRQLSRRPFYREEQLNQESERYKYINKYQEQYSDQNSVNLHLGRNSILLDSAFKSNDREKSIIDMKSQLGQHELNMVVKKSEGHHKNFTHNGNTRSDRNLLKGSQSISNQYQALPQMVKKAESTFDQRAKSQQKNYSSIGVDKFGRLVDQKPQYGHEEYTDQELSQYQKRVFISQRNSADIGSNGLIKAESSDFSLSRLNSNLSDKLKSFHTHNNLVEISKLQQKQLKKNQRQTQNMYKKIQASKQYQHSFNDLSHTTDDRSTTMNPSMNKNLEQSEIYYTINKKQSHGSDEGFDHSFYQDSNLCRSGFTKVSKLKFSSPAREKSVVKQADPQPINFYTQAKESAQNVEISKLKVLPIYHIYNQQQYLKKNSKSLQNKTKAERDPPHAPANPYTSHIREYQDKLQDRQLVLKKAIENQISSFEAIDGMGQTAPSILNIEMQKSTISMMSKGSPSRRSSKKTIIYEDEQQPGVMITEIQSLDELDFELRRKIQGGCDHCNQVTKPTNVLNALRSDPDMFEYIVKFRAWFKEAQYCIESEATKAEIRIKNDPNEEYLPKKHLSMLFKTKYNKPLLPPDVIAPPLTDEEQAAIDAEIWEANRKANYAKWRENMWKELEAKNRVKLMQERARVIEKYDEFSEQFYQGYIADFKETVKNEEKEKESLWVEEVKPVDLRQKVKDLLLDHNVTEEQFIGNLIYVPEDEELQDKYFEDIQNIEIPQRSKSKTVALPKQKNASSFQTTKEDSEAQKQTIGVFMGVHNREKFLNKKMKNIFRSKNIEATHDPEIEFAKQCHKHAGIPLPNLPLDPADSIQHYNLVHIDVNLPIGVPESINGITNNIKVPLKQIYLVNNQMYADEFISILTTVKVEQKNEVRSIIYGGKNEFNGAVYECIKEHYLSKRPPYALQELKLLDVRCEEQPVVYKLLKYLHTDLKLQTLSLSRVDLDARSADMLVKVLGRKAPCLKELDISWSNMTTLQMNAVFRALKGNTYLRSVNVAFNPISKNDNCKALGDFVRQNISLQHLDLSGVLQTQRQVKRIVKKAKKAQSLVALHLNHTPILKSGDYILKYIVKKLGAINLLKPNPNCQKLQIAANWKQKYELVHRSKIQAQNMLYYKKQRIEPAGNMNSSHSFVLQRTVAHHEIPSNNTWFIREDCYVCSRWKYTLFVSKNQGEIEGNFELLDRSAPKLMPVATLARRIVESRGKPVEDLQKYIDILPQNVRNDLIEYPEEKVELATRMEQQDMSLYYDHKLWHQAITKGIKQKNQQIINIDEGYTFDLGEYTESVSNGQDPKLWVYPGYLKPTHGMMKCNLKGHKVSPTQPLFVPEVRKDPIPLFSLAAFVDEDVEPPFDRDKSLFRTWQMDTPGSIGLVLKSDLGYWKAAKFVREREEQQKCTAIIAEYFERLKNIFVNLISSSDYPHVGRNDFGQFCREVDILDGTIPTSTVDRMFIATKVGAPREGPGNMLFRHEFLEIMIRIAKCKYIDELKVATTYSEALAIMLKDMTPKYKLLPWQEFRDESLWSTKIDILFKENLDSLEKIHEDLFPKYGGDGLKRCRELICRDSNVQLSDKETIFCFGMSKMTVRDEVENHAEYDKLRFSEFLEFIGRIAQTKYYEDKETPFHEKLESILDEIFPVFGLKRRSGGNFEDNDDTSDESLQEFMDGPPVETQVYYTTSNQ